MSGSHHDLVHLASLLEAALAQAEKLGPPGSSIAELLDQALVAARSLDAHGGGPDEGIRPEDLTTQNDK